MEGWGEALAAWWQYQGQIWSAAFWHTWELTDWKFGVFLVIALIEMFNLRNIFHTRGRAAAKEALFGTLRTIKHAIYVFGLVFMVNVVFRTPFLAHQAEERRANAAIADQSQLKKTLDAARDTLDRAEQTAIDLTAQLEQERRINVGLRE